MELREGCCGQFLPAGRHTRPENLLVVRTGASVAELKAPALRGNPLRQILATLPVPVNEGFPLPEIY